MTAMTLMTPGRGGGRESEVWCPPSLNFDSMMKQACGMVVEQKVVNSIEAPLFVCLGGFTFLQKRLLKRMCLVCTVFFIIIKCFS